MRINKSLHGVKLQFNIGGGKYLAQKKKVRFFLSLGTFINSSLHCTSLMVKFFSKTTLQRSPKLLRSTFTLRPISRSRHQVYGPPSPKLLPKPSSLFWVPKLYIKCLSETLQHSLSVGGKPDCYYYDEKKWNYLSVLAYVTGVTVKWTCR